ncbi:MAG: ComEC/Rec2 family competence protein, partial [Myxococcota bacterium]|nr:ComEC/Rec2 family competence protein [Myxococcota bacterium]
MLRLVAWTMGCLWGHEMAPDPLVGSLAVMGLWLVTRRRFTPWRSGLVAVLLGALWAGWWSPPEAPVASPEGMILISGEVRRASIGRHGRCKLTLERPRLDDLLAPGSLKLVAPEHLCETATPGSNLRVMAEVRGESWDANPGSRPPWAEPGWSWVGRTQETAEVTGGGFRGRAWIGDRAHLPGEEVTGLYRALLLGEKRGISPWLRDAFGDTGTAHLLAISGLHMAVVGWGIYRTLLFVLVWLTPLAQRVRVPALAAVLSVMVIWLYVGVVAPSQATLRAAVVLTSVMLSGCLGRWASPGHTLMVATAAVISLEPGAAKGASFQLSFAAATALVLLAPRLRRCRDWLTAPERPEDPWLSRAGAWLFQSLLVSLTTACATAPLCLAWFGQLAPVGTLVNLVAVPLVALVVVPAGMFWLIIESMSPSLGDVLAPVPTWAAGLLLDLVEGWAQVVGPSTTAMWPHPPAIISTCVLLCALARPHAWVWWSGAAGATALWLFVALSAPPGLSTEMLDVGHGDAVLLQLPGGANVLVDAGGSRGQGKGDEWVARRKVLPALQRRGVRGLDLLVITHSDGDHLGGAIHLARRLPIREVWLPLCDRDHPKVRALAMAISSAGGSVAFPQVSAPLKWSGTTLKILWPDGEDPEACKRGQNNGSTSMSLSYAGRRVLLTGDIEMPTERALVERWGPQLKSDVLKVA